MIALDNLRFLLIFRSFSTNRAAMRVARVSCTLAMVGQEASDLAIQVLLCTLKYAKTERVGQYSENQPSRCLRLFGSIGSSIGRD